MRTRFGPHDVVDIGHALHVVFVDVTVQVDDGFDGALLHAGETLDALIVKMGERDLLPVAVGPRLHREDELGADVLAFTTSGTMIEDLWLKKGVIVPLS